MATNEKLTAIQSSKYYIAYQTYEKLLTLVREIVGYVWCILHSSDVENFVPTLHCNQSSLEIFFSQIRHMLNNRTNKYTSDVQQQNSFNNFSSKNKLGNTSYSKEMIGNDKYSSVLINKNGDNMKIGVSINSYKESATAMKEMC